jgi:hypothetical protein
MWANHSFCPIHHHRAVQAVGNAPEATVLVVGDETWWNHDWDHAMGPCNGGVFDNVWNGGWLISLFQLMVQYSCWGINSNFFADSYTVVSWPTHLATISCVSLHVVVNLCKPTLWLLTYLHRYGKSPIVKSCWIIHAVNESNDRVGKCHGLPSLAEKTQQENSTTWNLDIYTKNYDWELSISQN